jgi:hypothetical protein
MGAFSSGVQGWSWLSWLGWLAALAMLSAWMHFHRVGWDVEIYWRAIRSLRAGHDPYADAMALQESCRSALGLQPNAPTPFTSTTPLSYIYSPMTLPLLRWIGALPAWFSGIGYWMVDAAAVLALVGVGTRAFEPGERRVFSLLTPAAILLPGMCINDTVFSGNVAFILYGLLFAGALVGWRRGVWGWFYAAVLLASCVKAPLLSLAVMPVLLVRRQRLPAGATAAAGVVLFGLQPLIWPTLFRHCLQAIEYHLTYDQDFGCSPAGLFSQLLVDHGHAYSPASAIFYVAYVLPLFGLLFCLSRRFLDGRISLERWLPVLLVGAILLNPRIMQYDVVALSLPLALILWRFLQRRMPVPHGIAAMLVTMGAVSLFGFEDLDCWKLTEGWLLIVLFAAGAWDLFSDSRSQPEASKEEINREAAYVS